MLRLFLSYENGLFKKEIDSILQMLSITNITYVWGLTDRPQLDHMDNLFIYLYNFFFIVRFIIIIIILRFIFNTFNMFLLIIIIYLFYLLSNWLQTETMLLN